MAEEWCQHTATEESGDLFIGHRRGKIGSQLAGHWAYGSAGVLTSWVGWLTRVVPDGGSNGRTYASANRSPQSDEGDYKSHILMRDGSLRRDLTGDNTCATSNSLNEHLDISHSSYISRTRLPHNQDLPHDKLGFAADTALANKQTHADQLQGKSKDLEELVSMGHTLQDAPDQAGTAKSHREDVVVV